MSSYTTSKRAIVVDGKKTGYYEIRHTSHTDEIKALRDETLRRMDACPAATASIEEAIQITAFQAAAALLESHDDTGVVLDNWAGPRELVEYCLSAIGLNGTFLESHV